MRTVEAIIDEQGAGRLSEDVHLPGARRALVTILGERPTTRDNEAALPSETALARDWERSEEDEAWSHLQQER